MGAKVVSEGSPPVGLDRPLLNIICQVVCKEIVRLTPVSVSKSLLSHIRNAPTTAPLSPICGKIPDH